MRSVPVKDCAGMGERLLHQRKIVDIHPVVVEHVDPEQRECGDKLRQAGRVAALSDALGSTRVIDVRDGLTSKARITRDYVRDQCLNARVSDILQLLPVRSVHIGLVRIEPGRAPTCLPDVIEVANVSGNFSVFGEWICRKPGPQRLEFQRIGFGRNFDLQIAPGAPPQWLEYGGILSSGYELVGN